jgi:hypothetical protein
MISMQQAANVASTYLHRKDVYSVEVVALNGTNVYLVTFSSGDLVYVGLDGKVISVKRASSVASTGPSKNHGHENESDDHEGGDN